MAEKRNERKVIIKNNVFQYVSYPRWPHQRLEVAATSPLYTTASDNSRDEIF